jgi:SRSO17 transposase
VRHRYCGQLGKQDNCQVAVTLSVANHAASLPVAYRLYLLEDWMNDPIRRKKAGVRETIDFATKSAIAIRVVAQAPLSRNSRLLPGSRLVVIRL